MTQLIPFNQAQGGTTPNMCLDNVRRGYGIANKYGSAWEAWQHTQQHPDRNVPAGLDVPLYYSYTATIDGSTQNYGHINVRLANGSVWSDGNIYASIDAYLANHSPKFVGWGESVNDVKIIEGETMTPTNINQARMILYFIRGYNGHNGTPNALAGEADNIANGWVGKDLGVAMNSWYNDAGSLEFRETTLPAVYKAAETPSGVKPYSGTPLFVKE
jgi:hypothetical protein